MRLFCQVMALSCNNGKKNMITRKLKYNSLLRSATSSTNFFMMKHYETFHLNQKFIFIFTVWELADVESEKYM